MFFKGPGLARERKYPAPDPAGDLYIYTCVHGQATPFIACIASPIAITSAIWAWNYTRKNRYETLVDSSIKVFDPLPSFSRCPFCPRFHFALDQTWCRAICYVIWCACVIYNSVILAVFRTRENCSTDLFR